MLNAQRTYLLENWIAARLVAYTAVFAVLPHLMDLYEVFWWWDILTHIVSGFALGALPYLVIDIWYEDADRITLWTMRTFLVLTAAWETAEVQLGLSVTGAVWTPELYGTDTVLDTALGLLITLAGTGVMKRT